MATEVTKDEAIARVVASATRMGVESHAQLTDEMTGIQEAALGAVNDYFKRALRSVPEIEAYLEDIAKREPWGEDAQAGTHLRSSPPWIEADPRAPKAYLMPSAESTATPPR